MVVLVAEDLIGPDLQSSILTFIPSNMNSEMESKIQMLILGGFGTSTVQWSSLKVV